MKIAKEGALIGIFTALLIGGQLALSFVAGVEVVTVLLLSFSFYFGARRGVLVATAFSLLRCIIFGFFPSVLVLYLIYYNAFAMFFGLLGYKFDRTLTNKKHIVVVVLASVFTVCFSLLDDVITPLMFNFTKDAAIAYFYSSFYALIPQTVCTAVTATFIFPPLLKAFKNVKI